MRRIAGPHAVSTASVEYSVCERPMVKAAWIFISETCWMLPGCRNETDSLVIRACWRALVSAYLARNRAERSGVGLRSQTYVDVSRIAGVFGGGGHQRAAGCTIRLPYQEALTALLHEIKVALASPGAVAWGD